MKEIIKALKKSKNVAIFSHISPDPDALGSSLALKEILQQKKIFAKVFVDSSKEPSEYPLFSLDTDYNADIEDVSKFDTLISVDVASKRMLGKYSKIFTDFENTISIDHHDGRDFEAKLIYNEPLCASCSEIIYKLAILMKANISPNMASNLFAGIVGDTACFQHDNVTKSTHEIAGELYKYGADSSKIIFSIMKYQQFADINLRKLCYSNMVIKNQIAYMIFTKKIMAEAGTDNTKPYVNELLNIEDNIFAFAINQKEKNVYTVSLRCKQGYNACKIAEKYGGGGHIQAAGFSFVGAPVKHAKMLYEDCLAQIIEKNNAK